MALGLPMPKAIGSEIRWPGHCVYGVALTGSCRDGGIGEGLAIYSRHHLGHDRMTVWATITGAVTEVGLNSQGGV